MKKCLFLALILAVCAASCGNPSSSNGKAVPEAAQGKPVEEVYLLSNQASISDTLIASQRKQAEASIAQKMDTAAQQLTSVLEKDVYHIQAVLRGSEVVFDDKVKAGWLDFETNHAYKYGIYGEHLGGGQYYFDAVKSIILLVDNDPRIKPQEFQALISEDALVLVGQDTYRDNNMQAKLNRMAGLPVQRQSNKQ